jgi:hypothetical protein
MNNSCTVASQLSFSKKAHLQNVKTTTTFKITFAGVIIEMFALIVLYLKMER